MPNKKNAFLDVARQARLRKKISEASISQVPKWLMLWQQRLDKEAWMLEAEQNEGFNFFPFARASSSEEQTEGPASDKDDMFHHRALADNPRVPKLKKQQSEASSKMHDMMKNLSNVKVADKMELLRNFASHQQVEQPVWQFLVSLLSSTCEDVEYETELQWREVESLMSDGCYREFGPMGELPLHLFFLHSYAAACPKMKQVMKELARRVVQNYYTFDAEESDFENLARTKININTPYRSDLLQWNGLGENKKYKKYFDLSKHKDQRGMYTGETVLHIAIVHQDYEMIQWLLDNNADMFQRLGPDGGGGASGVFFLPKIIRHHHEGKSGKVELRKNQYSSFASGGELEAKLSEMNLEEENTQLSGRPIVSGAKHMLYFGQFPLSFAVSVGDLKICKIFAQRARERNKRDVGDLFNQQDAYAGNTALHMAVLHGQREILDWLIEEGKLGGNSLNILNKDGYTPLTLAARIGNAELFHHILSSYFRTIVWVFGDKMFSTTSLEQVDTFRIQAPPGKSVDAATEKRGSVNSWNSSEEEHGHVHPVDVDELHADPNWRSALEVIIEHEIEVFADDEFINQLLQEKWQKFGLQLYLFRTVMPYLVFLSILLIHILQRCSEVHEAWEQRRITPLAENSSLREKYADFSWSDLSNWWAHGISAGYGAFLFINCSGKKKLSPIDVDPEESAEITWPKLMLAFHKNMSFMLEMCIGSLLMFSLGVRAVGWEYAELNLTAVATIFAFSYLLHILLAFKEFGILVILIYRMCVKDVMRFILIFSFFLAAFGIAQWILYQKSDFVDELQRGMINLDSDVGASILSLFWVSMREVDIAEELMVSHVPELSLTLQLVWIMLSTVLMLNLLISLMGQTFDSAKAESHRLWFFPWAHMVLSYETKLFGKGLKGFLSRWIMRFPPEKYRTGGLGGNHIDLVGVETIRHEKFYTSKLESIQPPDPTVEAQGPEETAESTEGRSASDAGVEPLIPEANQDSGRPFDGVAKSKMENESTTSQDSKQRITLGELQERMSRVRNGVSEVTDQLLRMQDDSEPSAISAMTQRIDHLAIGIKTGFGPMARRVGACDRLVQGLRGEAHQMQRQVNDMQLNLGA